MKRKITAFIMIFTFIILIPSFKLPTHAASINGHDFEVYSGYYYYDHLNSEERKMYDLFKAAADDLLYNNAICDPEFPQASMSQKISYSGVNITRERAEDIYLMFVYDNPQYYFLEKTLMSNYYAPEVWMEVYVEFKDPAVRANATNMIITNLNTMENDLSIRLEGITEEWEKELIIYEYVIEKLEYNWEYAKTWETLEHSQSPYSAIIDRYTVCTGYTYLFSMLCRYFGIECINIPSIREGRHVWNMVKIDGVWYNVDVTWDDGVSWGDYANFNLTSLDIKDSCHTPEDYLADYTPFNEATEIFPYEPSYDFYGYDPYAPDPFNYEQYVEIEIDGELTEIFVDELARYQGYIFYMDEEDNIRCYEEDTMKPVKNDFKCDGVYTYYFQLDGTAMRDRLTYHPDGKHVIYFDEDGHEVFSDFANVKMTISGDEVDDYCFFDVNGYLYVDVLTYDKTGRFLYYANEYGVMERDKWFKFSDTVTWADGTPCEGIAGGFGHAEPDSTLLTDFYTVDWEGKLCYMQGNGVVLY